MIQNQKTEKTNVQLQSWSKKRIFIICALGLVAVAGLFLVFGLAQSGSIIPLAAAESAQADATPAVVKPDTWTVSLNYVPNTMAPEPVMIFRQDEEHPFPEDGYIHTLGEAFNLSGTIYSNRKLTAVTVSITCAHNAQQPYPYKKTVQLSDTNTGSYSLNDPNTDSHRSLNELVRFGDLKTGVHTLRLYASCEGKRSVELFRWKFYVASEEWLTISRENFPDSYSEALAFFGKDKDKFLYRYQWVNGRYIMADPAWENQYITSIPAYPKGEPWLMHVDAVSYFQDAFHYLETSFLRVHGANGDTGILRASSLITEYNGCYVSRFTSSLQSISHHTFGTAVDVNASMNPNKNSMENKAVIDDDVKGHLTYNGLVTENGITYYDFFYDGEYETDPNGVPQTCVNYLLYELGFSRAGFQWAHYYKSTSDGMHFCLSEFVTYKHDGVFGLKKVKQYAEPQEITSEQLKKSQPEPIPYITPSPDPDASMNPASGNNVTPSPASDKNKPPRNKNN